jgi:tetratricopeptide (TPR) repeat protein
MKPSLCLNMIVRNEAARIARCLASVTATVKAAYILDTGSTDDTIEKICAWSNANKIEVIVEKGEFIDFSQARNQSFNRARQLNGNALPWCNFALLMDADMELMLDDPKAFYDLSATDLSYDMMQKGGNISYANRRLVNLALPKENIYVGAAHEYIDVAAQGMIEGAWFLDHADGSNRVEKYERDVKLLEEDLRKDPENPRSWFYLGNSYRDWGKFEQAKRCYEKRIEVGGWDEEVHQAYMYLACTNKDLKDDGDFVRNMLAAYQYRPRRAEPLHDLAKYYRERGDNHLATLFAKHGMDHPRPNDMLFVNDFVYSHGLKYEYSIAGYSVPTERPHAGRVANDLALDTTCPPDTRSSARGNLFWYTQPLSELCPSSRSVGLQIDVPAGYTAMNPSVVNDNGILKCLVRTVNYKIDEHGRYMIGPTECSDGVIDTRNFLCRLDDNLLVQSQHEVIWDRPAPMWGMVTGLEDMRIFTRGEKLWFNACARETNAGGVCQQVIGRLHYKYVIEGDDRYEVAEWKTMSGLDSYEKNWMHVEDDVFFHRCDRLIDSNDTKVKVPCKPYVAEISGSSQAIPFNEGWIAVVHEASNDPSTHKRTYWHRFVWWDKDKKLRRISMPFFFEARQIEFCAGLAPHPNGWDFVISYGVRDEKAAACRVSKLEVSGLLARGKFYED